MAIVFQAAQRHNPSPCDHFTITMNVDGTLRQFTLSVEEANEFLDDPVTLKEVFVRWAQYKRSKGATLASLIGQTMIPD